MFGLLLSFWLATSAGANVLFLDMNNSPKEIEAAQQAAKKSKRQLVVYPEVPDSVRTKITNADQKIAKLIRTRDKKCKKMDSDFCKNLNEEIGTNLKGREELAKPYKISKEGLTEFLKKQKAAGMAFPSLVISGHDGTGSFSGHFGRLGDLELANILNDSEMANDVRTIHLWGCYTTSPGSLMLNWKKHFPNISLFTGYDGRAPLNDKPAGWQYLKGVLEREPALLEAENARKLQAMLKKIPGANQVTAAIYSCEDYATLTDSYNFRDMGPKCEKLKQEIIESEHIYSCYLKASSDECANPPENTGRSPLRSFYELTQKAVACKDFSEDPIFRNLSRDQAIRLIFFREVINNFARIYAAETAEANEILRSLGAPSHLLLEDIPHLSRKEILEKLEGLLQFIQSQSVDLAKLPRPAEYGEREAKLQALRSYQRSLTNTLMDLSAGCVPFNWTEPHKDDPSSCIQKDYLGYKGVANYLAKKETSAHSFYDTVKRDIGLNLKTKEQLASLSDQEKADHYFYEALQSRISTYQYNGGRDDPDSKLQIQLVELQYQWAQMAKDLTSAEKRFEDPGLKKLASQYIDLQFSRNLEMSQTRLRKFAESAEKDPKILDDESKKRQYAELQADLSKDQLAHEFAAQVFNNGEGFAETERGKEIQRKIGDFLAKKEIETLDRRIEYSNKEILSLEQADPREPTKIEAVKKEIEEYVRKKNLYAPEQTLNRLELARKYLMTPRFLK